MANESNGKELVKAGDVRALSLKETKELGNVFVTSGMFKTVKSQAQAVVKILAGRELGLSPIVSMTKVHVIENNVAIATEVMADLIKRSGKYDFSIIEEDMEHCKIQWEKKRDGQWIKAGTSEFSYKEACQIGLQYKANWKNYRPDMLYCRALSRGAKRYAADAIHGAYVLDELGVNIDNVKEEQSDLDKRIEEAKNRKPAEVVEHTPQEETPQQKEEPPKEETPPTEDKVSDPDEGKVPEETALRKNWKSELTILFNELYGGDITTINKGNEILDAINQGLEFEPKPLSEYTQEQAKQVYEKLKKQQQPKKRGRPKKEGNKCACGKYVSKKVAKFSMKKYGKIVCYDCQMKGE